MKTHFFSYRTQIFIASLLLLIIPSTILGITAANQTASTVKEDFSQTMETILTQTDLTLNTLLNDATKIADMHILNNDIRKALITDYDNNLLAYSQDSSMFTKQLIQTNRLNSNVISCLFRSRYDYTFEYNILNAQTHKEILETMNSWEEKALTSNYHTYFAPIQDSFISGKKILPMVKILYDGYTFKEIGSCYVGIDFSSVETIFNSAKTPGSVIMIFNSHNTLAYCSDSKYINSESSQILFDELSKFSKNIPENDPIQTQTISVGKENYLVNGCLNQTTGWHIVQCLNNKNITQAYQHNLLNYSAIFVFTLLLGLILALFLSRSLTHSITLLCQQMDSQDLNSYKEISVDGKTSNRELQKLVTSFNHLNKRLTESLRQNYTSRLSEQNMYIQMLQTQINHHFLYNTLNSIKSIADIHNEPEIKTIASCMSELLRYNLKKVPVVYLEEEIQQIYRYLTILDIRFPSKFTFDCSIPDDFYSLEIPAFLLQPLVENSVEHGFAQMETDCRINLSANLEDGILHFFLIDNGSGIKPERLKEILYSLENEKSHIENMQQNHHFIGLLNVHQRIQSYYGKKYGLSIESVVEEGTIVDIQIPYMKKPELPNI